MVLKFADVKYAVLKMEKNNQTNTKFLQFCSFKNCQSSSLMNIKFHPFPRRNTEEWIQACQNEDLRNTAKTMLYQRHVCELHFDSFDYVRILSPFTRKLRPGVVPKDFQGR